LAPFRCLVNVLHSLTVAPSYRRQRPFCPAYPKVPAARETGCGARCGRPSGILQRQRPLRPRMRWRTFAMRRAPLAALVHVAPALGAPLRPRAACVRHAVFVEPFGVRCPGGFVVALAPIGVELRELWPQRPKPADAWQIVETCAPPFKPAAS